MLITVLHLCGIVTKSVGKRPAACHDQVEGMYQSVTTALMPYSALCARTDHTVLTVAHLAAG